MCRLAGRLASRETDKKLTKNWQKFEKYLLLYTKIIKQIWI